MITLRGEAALVCDRVCLSARPEEVEEDDDWDCGKLLADWVGRAREERRGGIVMMMGSFRSRGSVFYRNVRRLGR